ncbi:MAG: primosomal protein DnaI [Bacilli bacterium]
MKKIDQIIEPESIDTELIIRDLKKDPHIISFIKKHQLKIQDIRENLPILLAYVDKLEQCLNCPGLDRCTQNIRGQEPVLAYEDGEVELLYQDCAYSLKEKEEKAVYLNFKTHSFTPRPIKLEDVYQNPPREKLMKHVLNFIKSYPRGEKIKGIYAYGPFGSGKTFIMNFLANEMVKSGYQVFFAYYPDLVRKIKSSIGTSNFEVIVEEMKNVDILVLDDLGGESNNSFIRDEVLGAVLQARMNDNKPVFFTSNLSKEDLREHLATTKTNIERIKAERIIERICSLADFIAFEDKNYRI